MPIIPTIINHAIKNMVENLEQPSLEEVTKFRNSSGINRKLSWVVVIATSTYNKDQWKKTINRLFSKSCCDFKLFF